MQVLCSPFVILTRKCWILCGLVLQVPVESLHDLALQMPVVFLCESVRQVLVELFVALP